MPEREPVNATSFHPDAELPFELRLTDFEIAMQDVFCLTGKACPAWMTSFAPRSCRECCLTC